MFLIISNLHEICHFCFFFFVSDFGENSDEPKIMLTENSSNEHIAVRNPVTLKHCNFGTK